MGKLSLLIIMSDLLRKTAQFKADLKADCLKNPDLPEMDISNY